MEVYDPEERLQARHVEALAAALDWPEPLRVELMQPSDRHAAYGVTFADRPPMVLRIDVLGAPHGHPADHQLAADRWLRHLPIPRMAGLRRVPDGVVGAPAVVFSWSELTSGLRLCALNERYWPTVAADIGAILGALWSRRGGDFGVCADHGRFTPTRGSWADECIASSHALLEGARRFGVDLGPLSSALHQGVLDRRDALAEVRDFALVHGDLKPAVLLYDLAPDAPQLAGVDGWDGSMLGDPHFELGRLLSYEADQLAPVLAALPEGLAQTLLEPAAIARVEAYHLMACASLPYHVAEKVRVDGQTALLPHLETLRVHAERALEPGFARDRIASALKVLPPYKPAYAPDRPWQGRAALRAAASIARGDDGLNPRDTPILVAALGAALLALEVSDDRLRATAAREVAERLLRPGRVVGRSERTEPIEDPDAWMDGLARDMAAEAETSRCAVGGLLCTWLFAEARRHLGQTLSSAALRGLERTARTLAVHEREVEGSEAAVALHAVFGLAATRRLEALGIPTPPSTSAVLRERLATVLDDLPVSADDWSDAHLLPLIVAPEVDDRTRMMRPLLLLCLRALRDQGLRCSALALLERVEASHRD